MRLDVCSKAAVGSKDMVDERKCKSVKTVKSVDRRCDVRPERVRFPHASARACT